MRAAGKRRIYHSSRADEFRLWYLADIHWMSRACAEDRVRSDIAKIADDPYAFWIGGGDYVDFIGYRDNRFDPDSVASWVTVKQLGDLGTVGMHQMAELFRPIKDKCLGLLIGNHEKRYEVATEHESLHGWLCTELGAPDLTYCCLFDLVFLRMPGYRKPRLVVGGKGMQDRSKWMVRVFCHHGAGYAQTPGGKLNRLVQFMQSFDADLYFCGHVHDHTARKEPAIGADKDCKKLLERVRLGIVAGSYLRTYAQDTTTYGEQRGYRPTSLGAAIASIIPDKQQLRAII